MSGPFDVCVIGAGPAGYAAAMRAHDLGKNVLLVERDRVGGTGLHEGALSSKTMWHLSNDYAQACRTDRGYVANSIELSYRAVMDNVRAAVAERRAILERQLERLAEPSAQGGRVTLERGGARFVTPHVIELKRATGGVERFEAHRFVVATGSRPRRLPGVDVDGERIVTSDHVERWQDFPRGLAVVGAGVVGCEYAVIFANFKQTKIDVLDRQPRILPFEDEDVAERVTVQLEKAGVAIHRSACLRELTRKDDRVVLVFETPRGIETLEADHALVSVGREPATEGLGLAEIGVMLDACGGIVATGTESSLPHIHGAGDVTSDVALANVGELEGRHAIERMFGLSPRPIRYDALSLIMFLRPEVAAVGMNELQCKKKGIAYRGAVIENRLVNRNVAMRATNGFIKLLATAEAPHRILGLRVIGPQASACIQGVALLIELGGTLEDLDRCVHPHPAITEGVQECARLLLGCSIHKYEVLGPELLRCVSG